MAVIKLENVYFGYEKDKDVLSDINYEFDEGKIYAIVGRSGAGKTTLLSLLSGLASPTRGNIYFQDEDISKVNKYDYRSKMVGVVFQNFNLINNLTAAENIALSMDIAGSKEPSTAKKEKAYRLLESVNIPREESDRQSRERSRTTRRLYSPMSRRVILTSRRRRKYCKFSSGLPRTANAL